MRVLATFLLVALTSTAFAEMETRVYFADACSEKETKVNTPNGTRLWVTVSGLDPEEGLEISVTWRPALPLERLRKDDVLTYDLYFGNTGETFFWTGLNHVNAEGVFDGPINLPKRKWMNAVQERHGDMRIWEAEVRWVQPKARITGTLTASFYNAAGEGPYFQVLSRALCQWEDEARVDSKLYENKSTSPMTVTRERSGAWDQGSSRGLTLGHNNFQGNLHPLSQFNATEAFLGWLFSDWENQSGVTNTSGLEQKYTLLRNEAGVFVTRHSFNRHKVRRFEWKARAGRCGSFVPESQGYLDVGTPSDTFVVVPREFAGHSERLNDFIEKARPAINTCQGHAVLERQYADDVLTSGKNGLMFYYLQ